MQIIVVKSIMSSKVILLNGCGSSGKTSIARAIQSQSSEPYLTLGLDTFLHMLPGDKLDQYMKFMPGQNEFGPTMRVELGEKAQDLLNMMPSFAAQLARNGHNLVLEVVLFDLASLKAYAEALAPYDTYYVGGILRFEGDAGEGDFSG